MQYLPLATRMRPKTLAEVVGQNHLLAQDAPFFKLINAKKIHSMVFWGPPGTGKTTLAEILAEQADLQFMSLSAVTSGVKEIRQVQEEAEFIRSANDKPSLLFIDEIHRFNKSQQDALLPHIESGLFVFVGATTENPSFSLNNALLSRLRVYVLQSLTQDSLRSLLQRALQDKTNGLGDLNLKLEPDAEDILVEAAQGDARNLLNSLEVSAQLAEDGLITALSASQVIGKTLRKFDKGADIFYDQISALHKSLRGSAPDAALYWTHRMLEAGADANYICRRLVRFASEDIGNSDPRALDLALNAWQAYERLGSPEGELSISQAVLYLALAPKSNAVYKAHNQVRALIETSQDYQVPLHLRNAPTKLMKNLNYGKEYRYAHNEPNAYAAGENYFPEELAGTKFYQPVERGLEIKLKQKGEYLANLDEQAKKFGN